MNLIIGDGLLDDHELRALVARALDEDPRIDASGLDVVVDAGHVTISGRVGSEVEAAAAEGLIRETLGVRPFTSELVVDELRRGIAPEDAIAAAIGNRGDDSRIGSPEPGHASSAAHLADETKRRTEGTRDVQEAMEGGVPYDPPDRPVV